MSRMIQIGPQWTLDRDQEHKYKQAKEAVLSLLLNDEV